MENKEQKKKKDIECEEHTYDEKLPTLVVICDVDEYSVSTVKYWVPKMGKDQHEAYIRICRKITDYFERRRKTYPVGELHLFKEWVRANGIHLQETHCTKINTRCNLIDIQPSVLIHHIEINDDSNDDTEPEDSIDDE